MTYDDEWEADAWRYRPEPKAKRAALFEVVWTGYYNEATDSLVQDPDCGYCHENRHLEVECPERPVAAMPYTCAWCGGNLDRAPESRWDSVCRECEFG